MLLTEVGGVVPPFLGRYLIPLLPQLPWLGASNKSKHKQPHTFRDSCRRIFTDGNECAVNHGSLEVEIPVDLRNFTALSSKHIISQHQTNPYSRYRDTHRTVNRRKKTGFSLERAGDLRQRVCLARAGSNALVGKPSIRWQRLS